MPGGFIPPVIVTITGDIADLEAKIKAAQALLEDFAKKQYNAPLGAEVDKSQIQAQVSQAETLIAPWLRDKDAKLTAEAERAQIEGAIAEAQAIIAAWAGEKPADLTAEASAARIASAIKAAEQLVMPWEKEHDTELGAKVDEGKIAGAVAEGETLVKPWQQAKQTELEAEANRRQILQTLAYAESLIKDAQAKIAINADANTEQIQTAIKNAQAQVGKAKAELAVDGKPDVDSLAGAIATLQAALKSKSLEIPVEATGSWASGFAAALKDAVGTGLGALMGKPMFWGFARSGLAAELAGAGPFHIVLMTAGLAATVGEGVAGGLALTGTGATVGIIGELTQLTGTGGAANKIHQILALEKQMQTELATPGEAGQAKITANQIKGLYNQIPPAARGAINSAVGQILQFENLYQSATAKAQAEGATLIAQLTQTAKSYLGVIGDFAQKDINIILQSKSFQSFRKWMDSTANNKQLEAASKALSKAQLAYNAAEKAYAKGHGSAKAVKEAAAQLQAAQDQMNQAAKKAGGLAIFTELENIFTSHLSTNIQTFVTLLQKIFTTIAELAPRTGGGMQMLQHLVSMNWDPHIQNALTDWQLLKNAISGIWSAIKNFAKDDKTHIGRTLLTDLANLANAFANWESTAKGTKDVNAILQIHKLELQALAGVMTSMVTALGGAGPKGGTSAIVGVGKVITGVLDAISKLFQIKFKIGQTPILGTLLTDLGNFFKGLGTIVKEVPGIGPALAGLLNHLSSFFKGMAGLSIGETAAGLTALLLLFRKTGITTKVLQVIMKPVGMLATKIASGVITLASKITGLNIPNPFAGKISYTEALTANTRALWANTEALTGGKGLPGKGISTAEGEAASAGGLLTSAKSMTISLLKASVYAMAIAGAVQVTSDQVTLFAKALNAPGGAWQADFLKNLRPGTTSTKELSRAMLLQIEHDTSGNLSLMNQELAINAVVSKLKEQGFSEAAVVKAFQSLRGTGISEGLASEMIANWFHVSRATVEKQLQGPQAPMTRTVTNKPIAASQAASNYLKAIESVLAGHGTPKNLGNLVDKFQEEQLFALRKLKTGSTQQRELAVSMLQTLAKNPADPRTMKQAIETLINQLIQEIHNSGPKTKAAAKKSAKDTGQGYVEAFNLAMKESKGKIDANTLKALHIDPKTAKALEAAFKATGTKGIDAFAQAMSKKVHEPASAIENVIKTMLTKANQELKISSPSKVFINMGESSMEGLVKGFSEPVYLDHIQASLGKVKATNATFFAAMDRNMQEWGEQLMTQLAQGITLNMGAVSQALTHSLQTAMQTAVTNSSRTATQTLVTALKQGVF